MILYEYWKRLLGQRKARTKFASEAGRTDDIIYYANHIARTITVKKFTPEMLLQKYDGNFCLSGQTEKDQFNYPSCACATICAILEDFIVRKEHNQSVGVDWKPMWEHMIELGMAGKDGSYLQDNIWYLQNIGVKDNYGRTWVIDHLEKIQKRDIDKYLSAGHQIYTGSLIKFPMIDKNYVFTYGTTAGGHCYRIVGKKSSLDLDETTYKDFGYKKESQFFMKVTDRKYLFSCYAMTFKLAE